jgi:hypothetical protein
MSRILILDNCLDCPHHKVVAATLTGDSFDAGVVDVVCTKADGRHGNIKGRAISVSDRYAKRKECAIPLWCPLPSTAKRQ